MTPPFAAAATAPQINPDNRLVITSDWQDTIVRVGDTNFALLEFLSDAARAGHRVIITSTMQMYKVEELFELTIELGRMRGFDIADISAFEMLDKLQLRQLSEDNLIDIDYAFDDEPIETQLYPYGNPAVELRVHKDFSMTPFGITQMREMCDIPRKTTATDQTGMRPNSP